MPGRRLSQHLLSLLAGSSMSLGPRDTFQTRANLLRPFRPTAALHGTVLEGPQLLFGGGASVPRATLQLVGILAEIVELFFAAPVANVDLVLAAHAGVSGPSGATALGPFDEQGVAPCPGGFPTEEGLEAPAVHPSRLVDAREVEHGGCYVHVGDELVDGGAHRDAWAPDHERYLVSLRVRHELGRPYAVQAHLVAVVRGEDEVGVIQLMRSLEGRHDIL